MATCEDCGFTVCPVCGDHDGGGDHGWIGYQVRGVYDGVLIWLCGEGHYFPRFADGPRHDAAVREITRWTSGSSGTLRRTR